MKKLIGYILLSSVLFLGQCTGVKYSFSGGDIPGKTFSFNNFPNNASIVNPDLSILLQESFRKKVTNESNLKFVDNTDSADAYFEGEIIGYSITPVQATGDQIASLSRLTIQLSVSYSNEVDSAMNFESKRFSNYADFESSEDFNSIENELVEDILKQLVDQIFNEVLNDW